MLFEALDLANLGSMYLAGTKKRFRIGLFLESYRLAVEENLEPAIPQSLLSLAEFDTRNSYSITGRRA
ncbi:MAG: hypothetical protein WKF59_19910 [Chitinophagaceae bacterium]